MQAMDDMALLQEYAGNNSEAAFEALVARRVGFVYSAALRQVRDPLLAEEITQAVFIILAQKAGRISEQTVLAGWLFKTTRFTALAHQRAAAKRRRREQEAVMRSETESQPPPDPLWAQMSPLLDEALAQLGEKDRHAVLLRFFEEKSLEDVGVELGTGEDTARRRVSRALEKLRRYFSKRGVVSTAAIITGAISANSVQAAPAGLAKAATVAAIVRGTAASASTLALIKGALKIMAWANAKMAVLTGAVIIMTIIGVVSLTGVFRTAHPPQTGRLKLPTGNVAPMIGYGYSRYGVILASDGSLWSWGEGRYGWPVLGLADATIQNSTSLRRIGKQNDWRSLSVGDSYCLAVKSDGTLWGWGQNIYCQLGDGTTTTRPTPAPSAPGNDWKQAATGLASFGLKKDGTLWTWGSVNWAGQMGIGGITGSTNAVQVGNSASWKRIWAGGVQTVGLQTDGSLWFWGSLTGDANDPNKFLVPTRISPDTGWADVCFGYFTVFAIKSDGTLWSWGSKANFYTHAPGAGFNSKPMQVGIDNDWQACASSGGGFYHVLMKKDGSFWALDASEHRQAKPDLKYKPVKLRKIDLHKDAVAFAAGEDSLGVVLTGDGEVWTWGMVIGEHSRRDYLGLFQPGIKIIDEPWQLSNSDSPD